MQTPTTPVERVLLPLDSDSDEDRLLLPATVLASWFKAPLQIVTSEPSEVEHFQVVSSGLGIQIEPVVLIDQRSFVDGVAAHAQSIGPSLCVVSLSDFGLKMAQANDRATFLVADSSRHRLSAGPLAVEITEDDSDLQALAMAATWAQALDLSVRLVVSAEKTGHSQVADAEKRLEQIGIDVGVDSLRPHGLQPLVMVGRSRESTAVVVPQKRLEEVDLVDRAIRQGVSVLVAPESHLETDRPASLEANLLQTDPVGKQGNGNTSPGTGELSHDQCLTRLKEKSVGRIAYVDHGWPTVVPINYATDNNDVFIRSVIGGKLLAARRNEVVCLEIDAFDEETSSGWSVLVQGHLEVIADPSALKSAWDNDPSPWVESEEWQWLRLVPFSMSGREVTNSVVGPNQQLA